MMNWLQLKYTQLISAQLQQFRKRNNLYNFRCPVCNDSAANKRKARGYILTKDNKARFYCHNCGTSWTFDKFLQYVSPALYQEYYKEKLLEKYSDNKEKSVEEPTKVQVLKADDQIYKSLTKISALRHDHPVKNYIVNRHIPNQYHYKLFFVREFKKWVNTLKPMFENTDFDEPRLIIPLMDQNKRMFGFQGRSFRNGKNIIKYITILLDESMPKVYGLDTVDLSKDFYAFEGPIDSMFIENSIATCGSNIWQEVNKLQCNRENCIIVFDNQPRNLAVVNSMQQAIDAGYRICIWPDNNPYKDVNEMVMNGYKPLDIQETICDNTFSGLMANLRLTQWRKV